MIILFQVVLGITILRFLIAIVNIFSSPVLSRKMPSSISGVSILVPARNEAHRIGHLIDNLTKLNYPDFELLILDDESNDQTSQVVKSYINNNQGIRLIQGKPLPKGWIGKNWACHQLGMLAEKSYFLFLDADVEEIHPRLLSYSIVNMEKLDLSLLSIFPDQIMKSMGEKMVVPLMNYLLLSLLPLWFIRRIPFFPLAAANGQFMLFKAKDYQKFQWHKRVKSSIVEDIAIMRMVKRNKKKGMTFVSNNLIHCRMYANYKEALSGFSKNILAIFGNSMIGLAIYLGVTILIWPILIFYVPVFWLIGSWFLVICMRIVISLLSNQPVGWNIILHPLQLGNLILISFWSIYKKLTGSNEWKGRNGSLPQ